MHTNEQPYRAESMAMNQAQIDALMADATRQYADPANCFENGNNLLDCARAAIQAPFLSEDELNGALHAIAEAQRFFRIAYYRHLNMVLGGL